MEDWLPLTRGRSPWRGAGQGAPSTGLARHPHPPIPHALGLSCLQPVSSSGHHCSPVPTSRGDVRVTLRGQRLPMASRRSEQGWFSCTCCWEGWVAGS